MPSSVFSIYDSGMDGITIHIESQISNGLPSTIVVGMASKSVDEAKERLRSAFGSSGLQFPRKRIIINLAPADEPKSSASLDLGMAVSIIIASNSGARLRDVSKCMFVGELGLDGAVKPVRGILGKIVSAKKQGFHSVVLPDKNTKQAGLVSGIDIYSVKNLAEVVKWLQGHSLPIATTEAIKTPRKYETDFSDIVGHEIAKRCLEVAVAGGHNIILNGPPGTGKSMLAKSLPSIMPPLSSQQIIESTHIHSLVNQEVSKIIKHPPFQSPHHSSSSVAIIGGGQHSRPGEISLAHNGVLFLDELPEYHRDCLEALRQPLEDHVVTISRAKKSVLYPAHFMLVATKNPCPCGYYGTNKNCSCSAYNIARYNKKLSGPILDRIDLYTEVEEVPYELLTKKHADSPSSQYARLRIAEARSRQVKRNPNNKLNSLLTNKELAGMNIITKEANDFLVMAAKKLQISARSFIKTMRVSLTIADLDGSEHVTQAHISEALQYRSKSSVQY